MYRKKENVNILQSYGIIKCDVKDYSSGSEQCHLGMISLFIWEPEQLLSLQGNNFHFLHQNSVPVQYK